MKVYINYKINDSGKSKFLERLIPYLSDLGVHCSYTDKKADITLGIRRWRGEIKGPKVLRLDGVYMWREKATFWRNQQTKKAVLESDAVIWQSNFCKDIVSGVLKAWPKKEFVIYNGDRPCYCSKYQLGYTRRSGAKYQVIMSARWKGRPWKRLKDCVRVAKEVLNRTDDVKFIIAGKCDKDAGKYTQKGIKFLGHLPDNELKKALLSSDAMLNLSYYDWCPNAVVEALGCGLPIVCNNSSGAAELLEDNSCIVDVDKPPVAKYRDRDKPPKIDAAKVADAVVDVLRNSGRKYAPKVDIANIAVQYKKAFEEVLG